jgi:hypothetical protein
MFCSLVSSLFHQSPRQAFLIHLNGLLQMRRPTNKQCFGNYYTIIMQSLHDQGRSSAGTLTDSPTRVNRFGKRFDALAGRAKPASIVTVLEENSSSMDDDLSDGKTTRKRDENQSSSLVLPARLYSLEDLRAMDRR